MLNNFTHSLTLTEVCHMLSFVLRVFSLLLLLAEFFSDCSGIASSGSTSLLLLKLGIDLPLFPLKLHSVNSRSFGSGSSAVFVSCDGLADVTVCFSRSS